MIWTIAASLATVVVVVLFLRAYVLRRVEHEDRALRAYYADQQDPERRRRGW